MPRVEASIEPLDIALASLAKSEAALRLHLGQLLQPLSRGAFHSLGFSSLGAYVLERCDRSVRWAEAARCLARRVERLPALRRAMASGQVSWSMGELVARVAGAENEAHWLEKAKTQTVRQMRGLVATALAAAASNGSGAHERAPEPGPASDAIDERAQNEESEESEENAPCTLTCTVAQEDAWLFEATRSLLEHMGVHGSSAQSEALLAEAQGTLLAALPNGTLERDLEHWPSCSARQRRWCAELARYRAEAEARCERRILTSASLPREHGRAPAEAQGAVARAAAEGLSPLEALGADELDARVRALAGALARHELELSVLILRFHRVNGWRRLGYATETQYARERLGLSPSSLLARRALALRLERLPHVAEALGAGHVGVEAAMQIVRVATARTQAAWVERARQRTIKHLREEVAAARVAVRCSGEADCPPPSGDEMAAFHELEQAVVSGRACEVSEASAPERVKARGVEPASEPRRAWCVMLASLARWLDGNLQTSAADAEAAATASVPMPPRSRVGSSAGRVTLRLTMTRGTYSWWRLLEARAQRWLGRGLSWLKFLCSSMWQSWRHLLRADVAYGRVYIRDRYRCTSPVCNRRDVTPHHLRFRSAGGSDEDDNVASVCTWCHLLGVHGGRIRARGPAWHIHWELGTPGAPCLVVDGRDRLF